MSFTPTRAAGLAQLDAFNAGGAAHYGQRRNFDLGAKDHSNVSRLSPWIRHRLITEEQVLTRIANTHDLTQMTNFVQEVFWRGYFKGALQHRPSIWHHYLTGVDRAHDTVGTLYKDAICGRTGIACFDHWRDELVTTGYLHNHARMWFASIWIFTLRLPWELGADFFLTHLLDADPASNTLSWRWVGGLHTKGKTYLASAENIARFTEGRFNPVGQLALTAPPLVEPFDHPLVPLATPPQMPLDDALLLITKEDCTPRSFMTGDPRGVLGIVHPDTGMSADFSRGAVEQASADIVATHDWAGQIADAANRAGTAQVVTAWAPVGPVASALATAQSTLRKEGITLSQVQRRFDGLTWPHATAGFFKLKKKIPPILRDLDLAKTAAKSPP
ncbi:MAG: FAD-binding domain-containing protein [Celeribacter marinus]